MPALRLVTLTSQNGRIFSKNSPFAAGAAISKNGRCYPQNKFSRVAYDNKEDREVPPVFKTIVNVSIWILFIKGILIALVTIYTFGRAFLIGGGPP